MFVEFEESWGVIKLDLYLNIWPELIVEQNEEK